MIRTILSIAVLSSFVTATLQAEPPSKNKSNDTSRVTPAVPLKAGWLLVNGIWTHSDGYQFVKGQVLRVGTQNHKKAPKPPTKTEMDAAVKKPAPKAVDSAAAKAADREKNLTPRPARQTGTHL